jgi:hypothetical protein
LFADAVHASSATTFKTVFVDAVNIAICCEDCDDDLLSPANAVADLPVVVGWRASRGAG